MMYKLPRNYKELRGKRRAEIMRIIALQRHMERVKQKLKEEKEKMERIEEESRLYRLQKTKDKEEVKTEDVFYVSEKSMIQSSKLNEGLLKAVRTSELEELVKKNLSQATLLDSVEVALDVVHKKDQERKKKFHLLATEEKKEKKSPFVEKLLKEKLKIRR